jgi:hypothetical protein
MYISAFLNRINRPVMALYDPDRQSSIHAMDSPTFNLIFGIVGIVLVVWGLYIALAGPRQVKQQIELGNLEPAPGRISTVKIVGWTMVGFGALLAVLNGFNYLHNL